MLQAVRNILSSSGAVVHQGADAADRLPVPARDKVKALRIENATNYGALRALTEQLDEVRTKKIRAEMDLATLTRANHDRDHAGDYGKGLKADDPAVQAAAAVVGNLKSDFAIISTAHDNAHARWESGSHTLTAIDGYASDLQRNRAPIKSFSGAPVSVRKGETVVDAIERCRRRGRELQSDLLAARAAPRPSAEAKKIARTQIEGLAETGRPDVLNVVEYGEQIKWPEDPGHFIANQGPPPAQVNTVALLAWLNRDALIAAVSREIDEVADDANALTDEERGKRTKTVGADLLAVQREEEDFIGLAAKQGLPVARRSDADPRAVLGLADDAPAPRD